MNITIKKDVTLVLPDKYRKVKLPWKKKWLEALRSGKYRQGYYDLCDRDNGRLKYCCLGVLSKIQGRLIEAECGWVDHFENLAVLSEDNPAFGALSEGGDFPEGVSVQFGNGVFQCLAGLNDSGLFSFKDIAKVIELIWKN